MKFCEILLCKNYLCAKYGSLALALINSVWAGDWRNTTNLSLPHCRLAPSWGWSGPWRSCSTRPWSSPNWRDFTRKTSPVVNMSRQSSVRCQVRRRNVEKNISYFSIVEYISSDEHLFPGKFSLYNNFDPGDQKGKTTWLTGDATQHNSHTLSCQESQRLLSTWNYWTSASFLILASLLIVKTATKEGTFGWQ